MLLFYSEEFVVSDFVFQTKMSFDIICYRVADVLTDIVKRFQTKMSFDIICYKGNDKDGMTMPKFQTKMSFDIICYTAQGLTLLISLWSFKPR